VRHSVPTGTRTIRVVQYISYAALAGHQRASACWLLFFSCNLLNIVQEYTETSFMNVASPAPDPGGDHRASQCRSARPGQEPSSRRCRRHAGQVTPADRNFDLRLMPAAIDARSAGRFRAPLGVLVGERSSRPRRDQDDAADEGWPGRHATRGRRAGRRHGRSRSLPSLGVDARGHRRSASARHPKAS